MTELKQVAGSNKIRIIPPKDVEAQFNFYMTHFGSVGQARDKIRKFSKVLHDPKIIREYNDVNERYRAAVFIVHMQLTDYLEQFEFEKKIPSWIMKNLAVLARTYRYAFVDVYKEFEDLTCKYEQKVRSMKSYSADFVMHEYSSAFESQMKDKALACAYFAVEQKFSSGIPFNIARLNITKNRIIGIECKD